VKKKCVGIGQNNVNKNGLPTRRENFHNFRVNFDEHNAESADAIING